MTNLYSISFTKDNFYMFMLHLQFDIQWKAKCLFCLTVGNIVIIMVNKSSRFRDYDQASSRHVFTNFPNTDLRIFSSIFLVIAQERLFLFSFEHLRKSKPISHYIFVIFGRKHVVSLTNEYVVNAHCFRQFTRHYGNRECIKSHSLSL